MKAIINLDENFTPIIGTHAEVRKVQKFAFPGGEIHVRLDMEGADWDSYETVTVTHRITNSAKFMELILCIDALRRVRGKSIDIVIPYLPYARQDRVCSPGDPFSLDLFLSMLAIYNVTLHVVDVHSSVAAELSPTIRDYPAYNNAYAAFSEIQHPIIICPDKGATYRTKKFAEYADTDEIVFCEKKRDPATGKLCGFGITSAPAHLSTTDLQGRPCLIVDDICDGGGTFIGIAEVLKAANAGDLYLYVTHGIFSAGFDTLTKHFKKIYTTNSFKDVVNDHVVQYKIMINII